ncbi:MAG: hypothetical protein R3E39_04540 [Anaerolineae bacterium]
MRALPYSLIKLRLVSGLVARYTDYSLEVTYPWIEIQQLWLGNYIDECNKSDKSMERISAAGNLIIENDPIVWRLIATNNDEPRILVEAEMGKPVRYIEAFATKRKLSNSGILPLDLIQRVVLGWSQEDQSWHLGLLLESAIAESRGSRWCELARWPDPDVTIFSDVATQAGRTLARTIARPFNFIEPDSALAKPVAAPPPPLRSLPLEFDQWKLLRQSTLQLLRSSEWARSKWLRLIWYGVLASVYFVLSLVTLRGVIALPKPEFLPYLGLGVGAFLILVMLYTLFQLLNQPGRIVIQPDAVRAMRSNTTSWQVDRDVVEAVYVSEVVNRKGKKQIIYHGEINLCLKDGRFQRLLEQPHSIEDDDIPKPKDTDERIIPLNLYNAQSDLQMAGLYVAQALNVDCRYDRRVK